MPKYRMEIELLQPEVDAEDHDDAIVDLWTQIRVGMGIRVNIEDEEGNRWEDAL